MSPGPVFLRVRQPSRCKAISYGCTFLVLGTREADESTQLPEV